MLINGEYKMKLLNKICKARYLTATGEVKIYTVIRANKSHQEKMRASIKDVKKKPSDYIKVRGMNKHSRDFMTWKKANILEVL